MVLRLGRDRIEAGRRSEERETRDQALSCVLKVSSRMQPEDQQIYLNDLDVSADYMERLIEETLHSLPHVFVEPELDVVKLELGTLGGVSLRFRAACKVDPRSLSVGRAKVVP